MKKWSVVCVDSSGAILWDLTGDTRKEMRILKKMLKEDNPQGDVFHLVKTEMSKSGKVQPDLSKIYY